MGWYEDMMRQSFWGSYQDAADRRRRLPTPEEVAANDRDSYYNYRGPVSGDGYDQALSAQQTQAVAGGVIAGLAAMLHCSWMYAFIGTKMKKRYPEQIRCQQKRSRGSGTGLARICYNSSKYKRKFRKL